MTKTYLNAPLTHDQLQTLDKHVSNRLRARRRQLSLTQQDLAYAMGLSYQQIQKYETGANRVSAGRLFYLARALGVTVPYFFEGIEKEIVATDAADEAVINSRIRHAVNNLIDAVEDYQKRRPRGFLD